MARKTKATSRCEWAQRGNATMLAYHDVEWGVPVHEDRIHFEFLVLESAQAGLSWSTVLNKRDGYRRCFAEFDPMRVARFTAKRIDRLCADSSIIRNRLKIEAAVNNAKQFLSIQEMFGSFDAYAWSFVDGRPVQNSWKSLAELPSSTPRSDAMSRDMKRRGFRFFGTTICYAHMQAVGMVNDHTVDCFRHRVVKRWPAGQSDD